jgi:hypothetical protein
VCTNRGVARSDKQFSFSTELSRDAHAPLKWALATIGWEVGFPELGEGACVDAEKYALLGLCLLTKEQALALIAAHPSEKCLVHVHGFNTDLPFASRVSGLYSRSLHHQLTVLFAWPSDPPAEGRGWLLSQVMTSYERMYTMCEHNMHASIRPLLEMAKTLRSTLPHQKRIHWHAHSMGCYLLMNCMERLNFAGEDIGAIFK